MSEQRSTEPLYNVVPMGELFGWVSDQHPREMQEHPFSTYRWMIEQTSDAELAEYGETRDYLKDHFGIGTTIAIVARLEQRGTVIYHCDRHPGAAQCEHIRMVGDAIASRRSRETRS